MSTMALVTVAILAAGVIAEPSLRGGQVAGPKYTNKPRVRREWRTLSDEMRQKVGRAFRVLKDTNTTHGRLLYGPHFVNYDEFVLTHACTLMDPRCDQGHFGPHFMTFHRAFLLKVELALLAVDKTIGAMPYWNIALDSSTGKYRNDPEKYIFTDRYFGSFYGQGPNHIVNDGLFANWSVAKFDKVEYGRESRLAKEGNTCVQEEWFTPDPAETCSKCCFDTSGECECTDRDQYDTFMRNHNDCTPSVNRWPEDPDAGQVAIINPWEEDEEKQKNLWENGMGGSFDIVFNETDFDLCTDPQNTPNWMAWQNCIEMGTIDCMVNNNRGPSEFDRILKGVLPTLLQRATGHSKGADFAKDFVLRLIRNMSAYLEDKSIDCTDFMVMGYFDTLKSLAKQDRATHEVGKSLKRARRYVHAFHSQVHIKLGMDMDDVTTSPNDPGPFAGYHADIDRSNFHWMEKSQGIRSRDYFYPKKQEITFNTSGFLPYGWSGPKAVLDITECSLSPENINHYTEYNAANLSEVWLKGSLWDDVINAGFPFKNLFPCTQDAPAGESCTGGDRGYTHHEIIYWSEPDRTPYTYDTLEHLYYP